MTKRKNFETLSHADDACAEENTAPHAKKSLKRPKFKDVVKLLTLAAEGKDEKIEKLFRRKAMDVNAYNAEGLTALHQVLPQVLSTESATLDWLD